MGGASRQQEVKPWAAMAHWAVWLARDGKRAYGDSRAYFEKKRAFERPEHGMSLIGDPRAALMFITPPDQDVSVGCMSDCLSGLRPLLFHWEAGTPSGPSWSAAATRRAERRHTRQNTTICLAESHSWRGREMERPPYRGCAASLLFLLLARCLSHPLSTARQA